MFQFAGLASGSVSCRILFKREGFPIGTFPDQSMLATPRNLSQPATSFIASRRQGIHQSPLFTFLYYLADNSQAAPQCIRITLLTELCVYPSLARRAIFAAYGNEKIGNSTINIFKQSVHLSVADIFCVFHGLSYSRL